MLAKFDKEELSQVEADVFTEVKQQFEAAVAAPEPTPASITDHVFVPTLVLEEEGERARQERKKS
jgi:2-oxoisovalerate dehydrogenase E1 component